MELRRNTLPTHAKALVKEHLRNRPNGFKIPQVNFDQARKKLREHHDCECYLLPLISIVCRRDPGIHAIPLGWRTFTDDQRSWLVTHLDFVSDRKMRVVSTRQFKADHLTVIDAARLAQGRARNGVFEMRLLLVPPLISEALWLKRIGRGRDLVVVIQSTTGTMKPGSVWRVEDFLSELSGPARDLLEFEPSFDLKNGDMASLRRNRSSDARRGTK